MHKKLYMTILAILNVIESFILILQVYFFKDIIDIASIKGDIVPDIIWIISLIASLILLRIVYLNIRNKFSLSLEVLYKGEIYKSIMSKKYSEVSHIHSAELSNIYLSDVRNVQNALCNTIPDLFMWVSRVVFAFVGLLMLNYWVVIVLSCLGLLLFIFTFVYGKVIKPINKASLKSDDELNAFMQESVENIRLIKVLSKKEVINDNIDNVLDSNYKIKNKRNKIHIWAGQLMSGGMMTIYAATLIYAAYLIYKGEITYGTLTALVSLVSFFESPFSALAGSLSKLYLYKASKERIEALTNKTSEDDQIQLNDFDSIVFENMSFSYDNRSIYNNFNFEINKGDMIYIKGESGAGKTTLLNILLGFYSYEGNVYVKTNNKNISISEKTRVLFSYVPQENIIFSGTVRNNFKLFYPEITDEVIINSLNIVNLYSEIENQGGLDYMLYERGRGLSIGQIQRILIAIALASNKPILVLDEFSSALDFENEKNIVDIISKLNKTVVMVSHRTIDIPNVKYIKVGVENNA